jgi:NDMA-dependent alcohol dehydrogenase
VVEVGPGVTSVAVGDPVALSFVPACGRCPSCARGRQHLCDLGAFLLAGRQITDFTARHHSKDGRDLGVMCCLGTFAPYTVVNEASVIKLDGDIPLDAAALVGCGVTTGWGSAVYVAAVEPGETVVVVGLGGIGMSAVQGAAMAGARHVVAVDLVEWKRDLALSTFGATHTAATMEEADALLLDLTWGVKADKAILATGVAEGHLIRPLTTLLGKGGRAVVTAIAPFTQNDVQLNLFEFSLLRKELVGTIFGNANPRRDVPRLLRLYVEGKLKLDELITAEYGLDEVNQGYEALRSGRNIRGIIRY